MMGFHDAGDNLSTVSCSICLEVVSDTGDRSRANLLCGHQFHLDCIGSAFNVKGAMQCPNCRKIEKGQWLFANGGRAFTEFSMDEWAQDEDLYDFSYSEMSFGVHWCPFSGLTRLPTSFNEGEFSSTGYHDLLGRHAISTEHASMSTGSHPRPYVAYIGPVNPSPSNLGTNVSDGSDFSSRWTGNEVPASYTFPTMDVHYQSWDHPSPHFIATGSGSGGVEQSFIPSMSLRPSFPNTDLPRSASLMQPLQVGHSNGARAGNAVSSTMIPPYPGSNARARGRVQALQAYYQQPNTGPSSRTPSMSGSSQRASHRQMAPRSNQLSGFRYLPASASSSHNYMEAENPTLSRGLGFHAWEMDQTPPFPSNQIDQEPTAFHHPSTPDTRLRFNSYRQRRASERTSSQNRS